MSSTKKRTSENNEFISRFVEVCGSSKPTVIAKQLGISYQAAKNYLAGRMPEPHILIIIAEKTPYSLHWLLTGKGSRFADQTVRSQADIFASTLERNIEPGFLKKLNRFLEQSEPTARHKNTTSPKLVTLSPDKIKQEKEKDAEPKNLPEKQD
jgi:hypothetical protein